MLVSRSIYAPRKRIVVLAVSATSARRSMVYSTATAVSEKALLTDLAGICEKVRLPKDGQLQLL